MSHQPGQTSLTALRRWINNRPSVDITAIPTDAVLQPLGAHLPARDGGDHVVVVIDDVDKFLHLGQVYHSHMELDTLRDGAHDLLSDMVALRRTLHQWPEIGNDLPITRETVLEALDGLPVDVTLHETTSGIAACSTVASPGPRCCCAATWTRCR